MADGSAIEWTDATWNPVTGCTKITKGCDNCYAVRFSERFRGVPGHPFETGFDLTLRPERIKQPLSWRRPRLIFVNSMSDLFHKDVPWDFVDAVFDTMESADWHVFQVLTKRSSLMRGYLTRRYGNDRGPRHVWCGVSVEELRALKAEFEGRHRIEVRMETAFEGIDWVLSQRIARSTHRGVAFLDPFGAGLDWASVEKLAKTRLFEVVVNFPLNMAIIRMMPNGGPDRETWSRKLDALFGDRAWMDEVYEPRDGFFADTDPVKRTGYVTRLLALYRSRLKGAFGFVSSPRLISNSRGSPLYYLLWAGPNKKGLEGAEHVLTMGSGFRRSRQNPLDRQYRRPCARRISRLSSSCCMRSRNHRRP